MTLSRRHLMQLASHGAAARVAELEAEIAAIRAAFPALGGRASAISRGRRKPGRRGWNAAQRRAAARRMKAYWAKKKGVK